MNNEIISQLKEAIKSKDIKGIWAAIKADKSGFSEAEKRDFAFYMVEGQKILNS